MLNVDGNRYDREVYCGENAWETCPTSGWRKNLRDNTFDDLGPLPDMFEEVDEDCDGVLTDEDCDDEANDISPSAHEVCDGIDNNCDGAIDEDVTTTYFYDADNDGYGDENSIVMSCEQPHGYAVTGTDCNDNSTAVYPGNSEVCDGIDNDCNELIDEEDLNLDINTTIAVYTDLDGDGFGNIETIANRCSLSSSEVLNGDDCDDSNELCPSRGG